MEKNTILAIALSICVLFSYEVFFVAPKRAEMLKNQQTVENKEVTSSSTPIEAPPLKTSQEPTSESINEELSEIETPEFKAIFSNMGGSLHSIDIFPQLVPMPIGGILDLKGFEQKTFELKNKDKTSLVYTYRDSNIEITKSYSMSILNLIKATVLIRNLSGMSSLDIVSFRAIDIDASRVKNANNNENMLDEYSVGLEKKIFRKGSAFKFNAKEGKRENSKVLWLGFRNHYSAFVVKPEFETKAYGIEYFSENKLGLFVDPAAGTLSPGQSIGYEFSIYAGPQDIIGMAKHKLGFEKIVAFFNLEFMDWTAKAIYFTIPVLQGVFKSWGISIILISVLIYGLTYPLTLKSMMSMRKMQEIQPKLLALRERYKKDPQKLNAETMEIYKREKINPLGGCLPFLLQMPIFIALYQVLWRSCYFQGKGFLWIKDLSQPDRLFILPFSLPFLGNEFNILPVLMAIVMFVQQKISSKNIVVADETQAMQQKMMMYIFPFFIGFIFYKFASGLSLYFTMFYLFSAFTQWKMLGKTKR